MKLSGRQGPLRGETAGRTRGTMGIKRLDSGGRQQSDGEMDVGVNQEGLSDL